MDETDSSIALKNLRKLQYFHNLNNRYLIKLHDYFTENGNIYLITEFWEKGDLSNYLSNAVWLPKTKIWKFLIEITLALAYLHDSEIIHCDLKPQNIFISCDNGVKVGDLSSAMIGNKSNHPSYNFGTPCYIAPEVYLQQNYDNKVDIWSLGWIIYELWTSRKAFDSSSVETLKDKIIYGKPPKITNTIKRGKQNVILSNSPNRTKFKIDIISNGVDEDLQNIYLWWVQKDPQNRPSALDILSLGWVKMHAKMLKIPLPSKCISKGTKFPFLYDDWSTLQSPITQERL